MSSNANLKPLLSCLPLLGVMACVGAAFFLVIKIGFLLHNQKPPFPFDSVSLTYAASIILGTGVAVGIQQTFLAIKNGLSRTRVRRNQREYASEQMRERERRVAELAADPAKARYAPLVAGGESWTDEQIAYFEDATQTVTCIHLQPIERAIRSAGISVRWLHEMQVMAHCQIGFEELQQQFPLSPPLRYSEFYIGDRGSEEYPTAHLICDMHHSLIHTRHPDGAGDAPRFPQ